MPNSNKPTNQQGSNKQTTSTVKPKSSTQGSTVGKTGSVTPAQGGYSSQPKPNVTTVTTNKGTSQTVIVH
jgi:hypothetical protein